MRLELLDLAFTTESYFVYYIHRKKKLFFLRGKKAQVISIKRSIFFPEPEQAP